MKRFIAVLCALAFLGFGTAAMAIGPANITLPAKMMGNVQFPHAMHQKLLKNCKICHHKGVAAGACTKCHGVKPEAPKFKDAAHKLCRGCHKDGFKGMHGPTNCRGCHKK